MRSVAKRLAAVVGCLPPQPRLEYKHVAEIHRMRSGASTPLRPSTVCHGHAIADQASESAQIATRRMRDAERLELIPLHWQIWEPIVRNLRKVFRDL